MVSVAFVGAVESPYSAFALLCVAGFAHQTLSVTVITMSSIFFRAAKSPPWQAWRACSETSGCSCFRLLSAAWSQLSATHPSLYASDCWTWQGRFCCGQS